MRNDQRVGDRNTDVTPSILFGALASRRRQRILQYLADAEGPVFLDELAGHIADCEDGQYDRTLVAATLVHWQLPKCEDADLVRFDRDTHVVEEGPAAPHAARHLALIEDWNGH